MLSPLTSIFASSSGSFGAVFLIFTLAALSGYVFYAFCLSKIFEKAGQPGWPAYVPIYNGWLYYELGGKPGWLVLLSLLSFIPFLGLIIGVVLLVVNILVSLEVAKRFGKSEVFGIFMLFFFSFIGIPMLAFGKAEYHSPLGSQGAAPTAGPPVPPNPLSTTQPPAPTIGQPIVPGATTTPQTPSGETSASPVEPAAPVTGGDTVSPSASEADPAAPTAGPDSSQTPPTI